MNLRSVTQPIAEPPTLESALRAIRSATNVVAPAPSSFGELIQDVARLLFRGAGIFCRVPADFTDAAPQVRTHYETLAARALVQEDTLATCRATSAAVYAAVETTLDSIHDGEWGPGEQIVAETAARAAIHEYARQLDVQARLVLGGHRA